MTQKSNLIKKYNVPVPRYTSYPPVPNWNTNNFNSSEYLLDIKNNFEENKNEISLYIHLPYCESLCTYCGCNTRITVNHSVEKIYVNALIKEWELYTNLFKKKPILNALHLGGGTPTFFQPKNLELLINELKKTSSFKKDGDFSFEGHPNNTSFSHLKILNKLGFNRVSFGIQDFDDTVQIAINRIQPIENVIKVVKWSRYFNYKSVNFDLVYGLPFQSRKSIKDTLKKSIDLSPDRIAFYSYAHVPWIKPGQRKFNDDDVPNDEEKQELFEIGKKMFIENGYFQIGFDHFAKKEDELHKASIKAKLHRNFMGYTIQKSKLLVGLGATSCGESNAGYVQNEKNIEAYLDQVNKTSFPFSKGHLHSKTDLEIKSLISQLICDFTASISDVFFNQPAISSALKSLVNDKLIVIDKNKLMVTEIGKPFIRNICSVFDFHYMQSKKTSNSGVFSKSV